jgi:hypothetical protein
MLSLRSKFKKEQWWTGTLQDMFSFGHEDGRQKYFWTHLACDINMVNRNTSGND